MEQEPKLGKSLEGDVAIPEFLGEENKKVEMNLTQKLEDSRLNKEIDVRDMSNEQLFRVMFKYSHSLSADVVAILDKKLKKGKITAEEQSRIDIIKEGWFFERFGVTFANRKSLPKNSFKIEVEPKYNKNVITPEKKDAAGEENKGTVGDSGQKPWAETVDEYREEKIKKNIENKTKLIESLERNWIDIMKEYRNLLPDQIQPLLDKVLANLNMGKGYEHGLTTGKKGERRRFAYEREKLWIELFGVDYIKWSGLKSSYEDYIYGVIETGKFKKLLDSLPVEERKSLKLYVPRPEEIIESKQGVKQGRKMKQLSELENDKKVKMEKLHQALRNLDEGEPVDEFRDESRRVIYYDEESDKYFINDNSQRKYLGIGDILSDYAWGIKYVPDGEMIEPVYRKIAKNILVNEVRRDLEVLHDVELFNWATVHVHLPKAIERDVIAENGEKRMTTIHSRGGFISEVVARELLARVSINNDLDFAVLRANLVEDFNYKYDFKLKLKKKLRGVKIEDGKEVDSTIRRVGIQFTTHSGENKKDKKTEQIEKGRQAVKKLTESGLKRLPVDEILLLRMPIFKEVAEIYNHWLEEGKPSGGPEQFLSRDLKIKLLKEVTRGLVDIRDEDIERIFPKESLQEVEAQPVVN